MKRIVLNLLFCGLWILPLAGVAAEEPEVLWVDPKEVMPEETQRRPLSPEQTMAIADIQKTLIDVDILPLEEWLDGFRRDADPDREIAVWQRIAKVYSDFLKDRRVTADYKKEVFKVLVASSMMPREQVPQNANVKRLSAKEVIELMDRFYTPQ